MMENTVPEPQASKRKSAKNKETSRRKLPRRQTETFSKEELDLKVDLYPLAHYASDKDLLAEQLFQIIDEQQLRKMVPANLQNYCMLEIKEKCIIELMKMEPEEILKIIQAGFQPVDSKARVMAVRKKSAPDSIERDASLAIEDQAESIVEEEDGMALQLCPDQYEIDSLIQDDNIKISRTTPVEKPSIASDTNVGPETKSSTEGEGWVSNLAKSQLEILELEMRARAIRSLMKAQGIGLSDEEGQQSSLVSEVEASPHKPATEDENHSSRMNEDRIITISIPLGKDEDLNPANIDHNSRICMEATNDGNLSIGGQSSEDENLGTRKPNQEDTNLATTASADNNFSTSKANISTPASDDA